MQPLRELHDFPRLPPCLPTDLESSKMEKIQLFRQQYAESTLQDSGLTSGHQFKK
jgi:hypothetical protein